MKQLFAVCNFRLKAMMFLGTKAGVGSLDLDVSRIKISTKAYELYRDSLTSAISSHIPLFHDFNSDDYILSTF